MIVEQDPQVLELVDELAAVACERLRCPICRQPCGIGEQTLAIVLHDGVPQGAAVTCQACVVGLLPSLQAEAPAAVDAIRALVRGEERGSG